MCNCFCLSDTANITAKENILPTSPKTFDQVRHVLYCYFLRCCLGLIPICPKYGCFFKWSYNACSRQVRFRENKCVCVYGAHQVLWISIFLYLFRYGSRRSFELNLCNGYKWGPWWELSPWLINENKSRELPGAKVNPRYCGLLSSPALASCHHLLHYVMTATQWLTLDSGWAFVWNKPQYRPSQPFPCLYFIDKGFPSGSACRKQQKLRCEVLKGTEGLITIDRAGCL